MGADVTVVNPQMDKVTTGPPSARWCPRRRSPRPPGARRRPFVLALIGPAGCGWPGWAPAGQQLSGNGGGRLAGGGGQLRRARRGATPSSSSNAGLKADSTTEENDPVDAGKVVAQDPPAGQQGRQGRHRPPQDQRREGADQGLPVVDRAVEPARRPSRGCATPASTTRCNRRRATRSTRRQGPAYRPAPRTQAQKGDEIKLLRLAGQGAGCDPRRVGPGPGDRGRPLGAQDLTAESVCQASDTRSDSGKRHRHEPAGRHVGARRASKVRARSSSSAAEQVRVPDVVGLSRTDATTELQNAGSAVVTRDVTSLDPNNAGLVIAQTRPPPDSKAARGPWSRSAWANSPGGRRPPQHHLDHDVPVSPRPPGNVGPGSEGTPELVAGGAIVGAPLADWYARHGRHYLPWRGTRDRWAVLVPEVMFQQTQVGRVARVWLGLMTASPRRRRSPPPGRRGDRRLGHALVTPAGPAGCGKRPAHHRRPAAG